jgi:hypothetical protein
MAGLTTDPTADSSCCSPDAQATCCEPSEKSACCGPAAAGGSCGCSAGRQPAPPAPPDIRVHAHASSAIVRARTPTSD